MINLDYDVIKSFSKSKNEENIIINLTANDKFKLLLTKYYKKDNSDINWVLRTALQNFGSFTDNINFHFSYAEAEQIKTHKTLKQFQSACDPFLRVQVGSCNRNYYDHQLDLRREAPLQFVRVSKSSELYLDLVRLEAAVSNSSVDLSAANAETLNLHDRRYRLLKAAAPSDGEFADLVGQVQQFLIAPRVISSITFPHQDLFSAFDELTLEALGSSVFEVTKYDTRKPEHKHPTEVAAKASMWLLSRLMKHDGANFSVKDANPF